jgi:hypothetical protein
MGWLSRNLVAVCPFEGLVRRDTSQKECDRSIFLESDLNEIDVPEKSLTFT